MSKAYINRLIRFQLNSLVSTLVDFSLTFILTEAAGIWYLISTSAGTLTGGTTNFLIARNWVFKVKSISAIRQVSRYVIFWCCSILLNIASVYILTALVHINYLISKLVTAILIGMLFNYSIQYRYVFTLTDTVSKVNETVK